MQETRLPNKKDWAKQIEDSRRANKITQQELAEASGMCSITLRRVTNCESTLERMKEVEDGLREIIKENETA